jgi:hypothetical protein
LGSIWRAVAIGGVEVVPVGHLGDAVRRAGPGRLDEDRQAEALLVASLSETAGAEHRVRSDGDAVGQASFLVNSLSMAAAEAKTFAPTYGQAGHLEHALDGAVLAVGAVQHREDHVHAGQVGDGRGRVDHHSSRRSGRRPARARSRWRR